MLEALGAQVSSIPLISIVPVPFERLPGERYDWIFFTSKNAVRHWLDSSQWQSGRFGSPLLAAVGPATAKVLEAYGLTAQFVASSHTAEQAAEEFANRFASKNLRVLWPCGNLANEGLAAILRQYQIHVQPVVVYQTELKQALSDTERQSLQQPVDMLVFTSPSAVQAMSRLRQAGEVDLKNVRVACLGPKTAKAALEHWGCLDIQAEPHTFPALVQGIADYYQSLNGQLPGDSAC